MPTLAEAAALCGVDKSTLRRAVKRGTVSGTRDEFGVWRVEMAEVERVYPVRPTEPAEALPRHAVPQTAPDSVERIHDSATDLLVQELRRVIEDLRQDRDQWREQAQRLALPKPEPEKPPMTWWRWLRSTG
jgi:hypothetical protein